MFTVLGDLYHSKHIQGQAIEAWRHSFSHKLGANVLSPVIAISPDRTMVSSRLVVSFSGDTLTRNEHASTGNGGIVALFNII